MRRLSNEHRGWVAAAVLVTVVLAVGFLNYFLAGRGQTEVRDTRLAPTDTLKLSAPPRTLLHLDWGDGANGTVNDTVEYVFVVSEEIYVVDHVKGWDGSRVRWFGSDGAMKGEHRAPRGSTNFSPSADGFTYVIARSGEETRQTAVAFSVRASEPATYTVPLGVNLAGLFFRAGTLWGQLDNSTFDPNTSKVVIESRLIPVAQGGEQVPDEAAAEAAIVGNAYASDGRLYGRLIQGLAREDSRPTQYIADIESGTKLQVPGTGQLIGFDGDGRVYVLLRQDKLSTVPVAAGTNSLHDPYALLLIGKVDGTDQWVLPLGFPRSLQISRQLVSLSPGGIVVTRTTPQGLDVLLYQGDFQ